MNKALIVFFLSIVSLGFGQTNTFSPYSIYGLGEPTRSATTAMASMGHASIALINPTSINPQNPASYTDVNRPAFNFDLKDEILTLSNNSSSSSSNSFAIQNFSFAFPIINDYKKFKRRAGLSFGLTPYSNMGYNLFSIDNIPDLGDVEYRFFGEGGINALHIGTGVDILANKKRTNVLSAGVNGNYMFGTISKNRVTQFGSAAAASNLYRESNTEISDVDWNAGIRFAHIDTLIRKTMMPDSSFKYEKSLALLSIGAIVRPGTDLTTFSERLEYSFSDSFTRPNIIDTLLASNIRGVTKTPLTFGVGISANFDNKWTLSADLTQTMWSKLEIDGANAGLNDSRRLSLGAELIPEYDTKSLTSYMRIVRYRAGFSFEQTMLNISGSQPLRYGVSFGLGFPLRIASGSTSMFNIGAEVAQRRTPGLNLSENFFNIHAGFTITPNRYDQWFAKRKFD
jgi:hypothetical protein